MRLAINVLERELEAAAAACRQEGIGAEATVAAFAGNLDAPDFDERVGAHAAALEGLPALSSHGPFIDLYVTSTDPAIVEVCQRRHERALEASIAMGASIYVAHLNSIPLIREERYRERFVERCAEFWRPYAERAGRNGVTIALENLWEPTPELQKRVVERAGHPNLKASFDNGHALVFSGVRAPEWIEVLGEDLAHCHLHDNERSRDEHRVVGEGREEWPELLEALAAAPSDPLVVLECDDVDSNLRSLSVVRSLLA